MKQWQEKRVLEIMKADRDMILDTTKNNGRAYYDDNQKLMVKLITQIEEQAKKSSLLEITGIDYDKYVEQKNKLNK